MAASPTLNLLSTPDFKPLHPTASTDEQLQLSYKRARAVGRAYGWCVL
jgi:hypothetical protein